MYTRGCRSGRHVPTQRELSALRRDYSRTRSRPCASDMDVAGPTSTESRLAIIPSDDHTAVTDTLVEGSTVVSETGDDDASSAAAATLRAGVFGAGGFGSNMS